MTCLKDEKPQAVGKQLRNTNNPLQKYLLKYIHKYRTKFYINKSL